MEPLSCQRLIRIRGLLRHIRVRQSPGLLRLRSQILRRLARQSTLAHPDAQTGRDRSHQCHQTALRHRADLLDARWNHSLDKSTDGPTSPQSDPKHPLQVASILRLTGKDRSTQSRNAAELLRCLQEDLRPVSNSRVSIFGAYVSSFESYIES